MSKKHSRREFLKQVSGLGASLFFTANSIYLYGCDERKIQIAKTAVNVIGKPKYKKVILLGMDGLDPKVLTPLMNKGGLPNFYNLSKLGAYSPLATSNPPQSPVAWASIATGNNPGYHGVFDFLNRRVTDYVPELAILIRNPDNLFGRRGAMFLPVMQGNSFWDYTSAHGIPSTVIKWPVTFQPKQNKTRLLSGLGVPDLKGGLGTYTLYTTKNIPKNAEGADKTIKVRIKKNNIKTFIYGPDVSGLLGKDTAKTDLEINVLPGDSTIKVSVNRNPLTVKKGLWSDWLEVEFDVGFFKTVKGIVKFYLNRAGPDFELYMTAVQISPREPAFIISSPDSYVKDLASDLGNFYTLGISEDTKALSEGSIDDDAFISMCYEIIDEQEKMLWHELDKFKEGLLSFGFYSTDRIQHMFWAARDPEHPLFNKEYSRKYGHVIDDVYWKMDQILGKLMKHVDDETALITFSDHGFATFRRNVHLNSWLVENEFMRLTRRIDKYDKEGGSLFKYVDWKNTQAYALGFGSVYLNLKGREKKGIVKSGTMSDSVLNKISEKLLNLKDPKNHQYAVKNVYKSSNIYSGNLMEKSPDLIVGFHEGYRVSWQTAIGGSPAGIFEDNLKKWSGDHIMDPSVVPGILLTNFKFNNNTPSLIDIAPTVLSCFGLSASDMEGKTLL